MALDHSLLHVCQLLGRPFLCGAALQAFDQCGTVAIRCVSFHFTLFDHTATNTHSPQARIADTLTLILRTLLRYNQLGLQWLARR